MAKPYSMDLRERAMRRVAAGESARSVAVVLKVSASSVINHPFILPISGRKSRSIIVGIPSTVGVFGSNTASSAPAVGLSTSRRRPA